jgi:hypothetical protein
LNANDEAGLPVFVSDLHRGLLHFPFSE